MESAGSSEMSYGVSSNGSSAPYADIECASNMRLLTNKESASIIFQGSKPSARARAVAVISLVISSLCLLSLGGFCAWVFVINDGHISFSPQNTTVVAKETEVCLPCLQVSPSPFDNSASDLWAELDVRVDGDQDEICCATSTAQYAALFKLILQRQQEVKKLADTIDAAPPAIQLDGGDSEGDKNGMPTFSVSAHLVFKPQQQGKSGKKDDIQHWKSPNESPMSHIKAGLSFHDNRIFVQTSGLYYIYCQILYTLAPEAKSPNHVASTYIRRYSILRPTAPDFLLKTRHTRADVQGDRHSSYVGGVFQLHKGDTLFVEVSQPGLISHDDMASFFGLFRVGGVN